MTVKVSSEDSEGRYSVIEMVRAPNVGPALHIHPTSPLAYYVLEGEYFVTCKNDVHIAMKGDSIISIEVSW